MDRNSPPSLSDFIAISNDKIRYCDTDRQGHVNNAVFSTFLETGRVDILYSDKSKLLCKSCSFVIASIELDYIAEISWPGEVQIGTRVSRVGNSSITLEQGLFQFNKCVAIAETVIVQINQETKRSSLLTEEAILVLKQLKK